MSAFLRTAFAVMAAGVVGTAFSEAWACSVCLAGDPNFSTHGTSAQQKGDFSLYLELKGWRKTSGHPMAEGGHEHEEAADHEHAEDHGEEAEEGHAHADEGSERNRSQRLDIFASWTPLDRLTLTLDAPFARNHIVEEVGEERTRSTLAGFGDISLLGSVVLWRNREVLPVTWIEGRVFVKAPTGSERQKVDGHRDPHLQLGTGSWDFGLGLAAAHRMAWGALYGSVFYRNNTEGALDYAVGDVFLANVAAEVPLEHFSPSRECLKALTAGLELNFRSADYDLSQGERFEDSGGAILYATPSLRIRLPWDQGDRSPSLRLAVQLPLVQTWLHNQQREKEVWSVGLFFPF